MGATGENARVQIGEQDFLAAIVAAEGKWDERDVEEWAQLRRIAWATWPVEHVPAHEGAPHGRFFLERTTTR